MFIMFSLLFPSYGEHFNFTLVGKYGIYVKYPNILYTNKTSNPTRALRRISGSNPVFCETQWRHSVKIRLYNTRYPILHSVKHSYVTRWKRGYVRPLPILPCISQLGEHKGGQGHWVSQNN